MNPYDAALMEMWWSGFATACFIIAGILILTDLAMRAVKRVRARRDENDGDSDPYAGFTPPAVLESWGYDEHGSPGKRMACFAPDCTAQSAILPYDDDPTDEGTLSANHTTDESLHEWKVAHIARHREGYRLAQIPA